MQESAEALKNFKDAINSVERWTLQAMYEFLTSESQLKQLMAVGRYDNFSRTQVVTVADNGSFRTFGVNNGVVSRSKTPPAFCRGWSIATGGRTEHGYREGGFFGKEGYKRTRPDKENRGPMAKRRWGDRGGNRGYRGGSRR